MTRLRGRFLNLPRVERLLPDSPPGHKLDSRVRVDSIRTRGHVGSGAVNNRRLANFLGFLACAGLMGYAYYSQYALGFEPCPLCIFQRVGVVALGVVFLIAALHNPKAWGRYVYAGLIGLAALATIGVAGRHLYVQSLPPGSVPSCGAPLDVLLQFTPVFDVIKKVLTGGGECQEVNWTFLGLAMPAWVLISAVVIGVAGVLANVRRPGPPALSLATKT
jgi:protein dithiol:quinone oxidoreductase